MEVPWIYTIQDKSPDINTESTNVFYGDHTEINVEMVRISLSCDFKQSLLFCN